MKTWSKKVMTLACATCLTVGMAAVACADTIDLGYGQYATTNNGVHAVAVDAIPTNPTERWNKIRPFKRLMSKLHNL